MVEENLDDFDELLKNEIDGEIIDKTVSRLTGAGDNYLSLMMKVDVKIKKGNKEDVLHTVAKLSLSSVSEEVYGISAFKNEIKFYTKIIPSIQQFQKQHGVEVADFFPKIYGSRIRRENGDGKEEALIILENVMAQGYNNVNRQEGFDLVTAKAVLEDLAVLHAVSMAMKLEDPEQFEKEIKPNLRHLELPEPPGWKSDIMENIVKLIERNPDCSALAPRFRNVIRFFPNDLREPWSAVCHGDCWATNIMVKYKNGETPKIKLLDFQLSPYRSITSDVLLFLFTSTNTLVLKDHLDELIRFYYDRFIENLEQLGSDTGVFTYESYLKEIVNEAKSGQVSTAIHYLFVIFAEKDKSADVKDEGFDMGNLMDTFKREPSPPHKERIFVIVKECAKKNWI